MNVSLEQAIQIHAKALVSRHKHAAPAKAREHAGLLKANGDHEGHDVWLRVADAAEELAAFLLGGALLHQATAEG
jgi:hypothetical protein